MLLNALKEQGRTMNWLVAQLNKTNPVTRQYVSAMMNGKRPMSEAWERRIKTVLGLF
jgi:hypothetical protein